MTVTPTATYRLQLTPEFGFEEAKEQIAYLKKMGVSHVYLSPIWQAESGSPHGYNVADPTKINPELGGEAAFRDFAASLKAAGIGIVADFVPNHVGIEKGETGWWQSVLRDGQASKYAKYFDIFLNDHSDGKLVLPFLGNDIEQLIGGNSRSRHPITGAWVAEGQRSGAEYPEFSVRFDDNNQQFHFDYWGTTFPINDAGQTLLASSSKNIDQINHDSALISDVLSLQHYRPIHWVKAPEEVNYRRFFTVNGLAGLRVEEPEVFAHMHQKLAELVKEGLIQGIRLDHIDGLADPKKYFDDLRALVGPDIYIVAEKILAPDEKLPEDWPIQGTTGYDAMIPLGQLFTRDSEQLSNAYQRFIEADVPLDYEAILRDSRMDMMDGELLPELRRLTRLLVTLAEHDANVDLSPEILRESVKAFTAAMPAYRTYIQADGVVNAQDKALIEYTKNHALEHTEGKVSDGVRFIADVMSGAYAATSQTHEVSAVNRDFVQRFQQFAGPVIAKGTEDTAFYRYHILRGAAEVGAELDQLGMSPEAFTEFMQSRMAHTMNAFSTHDTKLGEDTRIRSLTLSHIPDIWADTAEQWKALHQHYKQHSIVNGEQIALNDQYLLYQTVVATLPLDVLFGGAKKVDDAYIGRIQLFMEKATREAKEHTAWTPAVEGTKLADPNMNYEGAVKQFVAATLRDEGFVQDHLVPFVQKIAIMGANVGLSARALQTMMPGMPDIYQGSESWNLTMVDPDNRDTADFTALKENENNSHNLDWEALSKQWPDGAVKQVLTQSLLHLRAENPELFASNATGELIPLKVYDANQQETDKVYAFARVHGDKAVVVAVPRILDDTLFSHAESGQSLGVKGQMLDGFVLDISALPEPLRQAGLVDALNNAQEVAVDDGKVNLSHVFDHISAAVMGAGIKV